MSSDKTYEIQNGSPVGFYHSNRGFKQYQPQLDKLGQEFRIAESSGMSASRELWLFAKQGEKGNISLLLDNDLTTELMDALRHRHSLDQRDDVYGAHYSLDQASESGDAKLTILPNEKNVTNWNTAACGPKPLPETLELTAKDATVLADTLEWASANHWSATYEEETSDHATGWAPLFEVGTGADYRTGIVLLNNDEEVVSYRLDDRDLPGNGTDDLVPMLRLTSLNEYEPIELTTMQLDNFIRENADKTF